MRNMNLRMPSRRLITALSEMAIVRPRYLTVACKGSQMGMCDYLQLAILRATWPHQHSATCR